MGDSALSLSATQNEARKHGGVGKGRSQTLRNGIHTVARWGGNIVWPGGLQTTVPFESDTVCHTLSVTTPGSSASFLSPWLIDPGHKI